jgi:hypothetical protein
VATDGTQKGKQSGKGFAGLDSMLSDVDEAARTAETDSAARAAGNATPSPENAAQTGSAQRTRQRTAASEPGHAEPSAPAAPPQPGPSRRVARDPGSGVKWLKWGGAALVLYLLWLGSSSDKPSSRRYDAPPATTGIDFSSQAALTEEKPPVDTDRVLTAAQLRYCVSEKIRVEAANKALNVYVPPDVDRFNAMVDDYNSRCGSFRYRRGALESTQADVERSRFILEAEGRARLSQTLGGR